MLKRLTSLILNLGRFLKRLMELPLYHASGIIPRNKNLWVVGAWRNEFVDNPKYFFISTSLNKDLNVKCVWLSRSSTTVKFIKEMGFESVKSSSLKGIYISLRAGIYFYNSSVNDISFIASKGAILVNLWHGIPLKLIKNDSLRFKKIKASQSTGFLGLINRIFNPRTILLDDLVLSPSNYVTKYSFSSAFEVPTNKCLAAGYPRTDIYFMEKKKLREHINKYEPKLCSLIDKLGRYNKIYLYAPTYRNTSNDLIKESGIDLNDLDAKLVKENSYLLLKFHPSVNPGREDIAGLKRIVLLDNSYDINALFEYVDVLITDYSSVYFDFLLLDRKVIFFCYDLNKYIKHSRALYFNYNDVTPGQKVISYNELYNAMFSDEDLEWASMRTSIRKRFWGEYAGGASEKLINHLAGSEYL